MAYYNFKYPFALAKSQPSLMGGITVPSQPETNLQTGLISTTPQEKLNPMAGAKNEKLALMLYALGGALKGDKNFMQNTLQLQQMQEGKKKQKEQEKVWEDWKDKNLDTLPESIRDLTDIVTAEQGINLAIKTATTPPQKITTDRIRAALLKKINDFGYGSLTTNEKETLAQIQNLDPFERRTRGLGRTPGTGTGNNIQNGYIDTGETTQDGKKIFKDRDGNRFVETGS